MPQRYKNFECGMKNYDDDDTDHDYDKDEDDDKDNDQKTARHGG